MDGWYFWFAITAVTVTIACLWAIGDALHNIAETLKECERNYRRGLTRG